MSSRQLAGSRKNKPNFQETKADKSESKEKQTLRPSGGFFIKPSHKNKKNIASDVTANRTNKTVTSEREWLRKKEKEPHPAQNEEITKTKTQLFDKKAWRFKRYSKKFKLDQWKDVRKTQVLRGLNKMTCGEKNTSFNFEEELDRAENTTQDPSSIKVPGPLSDDDSKGNNTEQKYTKPSKKNSFAYRNNRNYEDEEINTKKMESLKRKAAKEEAIKEYKRKKMEKFKKLSRKTKKGQPVMKDRMEVLLEEIQNSMRQ